MIHLCFQFLSKKKNIEITCSNIYSYKYVWNPKMTYSKSHGLFLVVSSPYSQVLWLLIEQVFFAPHFASSKMTTYTWIIPFLSEVILTFVIWCLQVKSWPSFPLVYFSNIILHYCPFPLSASSKLEFSLIFHTHNIISLLSYLQKKAFANISSAWDNIFLPFVPLSS